MLYKWRSDSRRETQGGSERDTEQSSQRSRWVGLLWKGHKAHQLLKARRGSCGASLVEDGFLFTSISQILFFFLWISSLANLGYVNNVRNLFLTIIIYLSPSNQYKCSWWKTYNVKLLPFAFSGKCWKKIQMISNCFLEESVSKLFLNRGHLVAPLFHSALINYNISKKNKQLYSLK